MNPPKGKKRKPGKGELPNSLLSQLNENSAGGYLVITLDADGEPHVYSSFDNPMYRVALTRFAADFFGGADEAIGEAIRNMNRPQAREEEEENEGGSEEYGL